MAAKVVGTMAGATDAFCKYCHTAELFHRPWAMMSCNCTFESKARVAPDLRNKWNPCPCNGIFK